MVINALFAALGAAMGVYVIVISGFAVWAHACWSCVANDSGDRRSDVFRGVALYYGPVYWIAAFILSFVLALAIQLGASAFMHRQRH